MKSERRFWGEYEQFFHKDDSLLRHSSGRSRNPTEFPWAEYIGEYDIALFKARKKIQKERRAKSRALQRELDRIRKASSPADVNDPHSKYRIRCIQNDSKQRVCQFTKYQTLRGYPKRIYQEEWEEQRLAIIKDMKAGVIKQDYGLFYADFDGLTFLVRGDLCPLHYDTIIQEVYRDPI